jgi:hypothetical protein
VNPITRANKQITRAIRAEIDGPRDNWPELNVAVEKALAAVAEQIDVMAASGDWPAGKDGRR